MSYKKKNNYLVIYSGPYANDKERVKALKKLQIYFPYARKSTRTRNESPSTTSVDTKTEGFFVGVSFDYTSAFMQQTNEVGYIDITEPRNEGTGYGLFGGYEFSNAIATSVSYTVLNTGDLKFTNMYATLDYKFYNSSSFVPYVGVIVGFSELEWMIDPIANATSSAAASSSSPLYGTQIGGMYKIFKSSSILINYNCLFLDHVTNIEKTTNKSTVKHSLAHSLQAGIQYKF